jgi:AbrB family looped-hinge helix DNA binding protein
MATNDPTLEYLTARISEKGEVMIPKQFCEDLGLRVGSPVAIFRLGDGFVLRPEQGRVPDRYGKTVAGKSSRRRLVSRREK